MDESPSVCPWQRSWTIFRRWYRALILDDFLSITSTSPLAFCHKRTLVAYPDVKSYVETYVEIHPFTSSLQLQWSLATFQWPMVNFKYPPFREVTLEVMKMAHNLSDGAFCGRTAQLHTTCPGSPATITMMAELIMVWVLVLGPTSSTNLMKLLHMEDSIDTYSFVSPTWLQAARMVIDL